MNMKDAAIELAEKGTPVFPCLEKEMGSKTAKTSYVGYNEASTNFNTIHDWWSKHPNAAIGVPTGKTSGITMLDLCVNRKTGTNGKKSWEDMSKRFEYTPYQTKQVQSPSGGFHLYYKYNKSVNNSKNKIAIGINTINDNGYIIVPPSQIGRKTYQILKELPMIEVPPFASDIFVDDVAYMEIDTSNLSVTAKSVRKILNEISPSCSYEAWKNIGLGLFNWDYERGFDLWKRWSSKGNTSSCRTHWEQFINSSEKKTLGYLVWLAKQSNPLFEPSLNRTIQAQINGAAGGRPRPNYKELGTMFLENNWTYDEGIYTLKNWNSSFYKYREGKYHPVNQADIKANVMSHLQDNTENPTSHMVAEVLCNIDSNKYVHVSSEKRPPCLLSSNSELNTHRWINFDNGFFDLTEYMKSGNVTIKDHSPDLFSLIKIPYAIEENAKCPGWEAAMSLYLDGDKELIKLTQMLCGYCLTPNRKYNIIAFLHGEGGTAKSTVLEVLAGIVGVENTSKLTLNELTDRFSKVELTTKLVNITSETEVSGDLRINEAVIKTMTDGSSIYVEEKNKQGHVADVTAQLLIAANTMPSITDKTMGMWRRMVIIPFNKILSGTVGVKVDFAKYILEKEAPGIIMWMLKGLSELHKHQEFPKPKRVKDIISELREESDKERTFLLDFYEIHNTSQVFANDLYSDYKEEMSSQGHKTVMGTRRFYAIVNMAFKNIKRSEKRIYRKGKPLSYVFTGINKKNDMILEKENRLI